MDRDPWGNEDSPVIAAAAETGLERELAGLLMHGTQKPKIRTFDSGEVLAAQGTPGDTLFLVLDGVVDVVSTAGPWAISARAPSWRARDSRVLLTHGDGHRAHQGAHR